MMPENVKIFLAVGPTDMRKSFDTLAGLVRTAIAEDPLSGHLFVFCNRRRDRLKILLWESSGFWLYAKRLERGTFAWPTSAKAKMQYSPAELALLLGGLDVSKTRRRRWYNRDANGVNITCKTSRR
jgi:transposase